MSSNKQIQLEIITWTEATNYTCINPCHLNKQHSWNTVLLAPRFLTEAGELGYRKTEPRSIIGLPPSTSNDFNFHVIESWAPEHDDQEDLLDQMATRMLDTEFYVQYIVFTMHYFRPWEFDSGVLIEPLMWWPYCRACRSCIEKRTIYSSCRAKPLSCRVSYSEQLTA